MDRKAQIAWPTKETGDTALRIIAVFILLIVIGSIVGILTKNRPLESAFLDFERVVVEISDISVGESITVPITSEDYELVVRENSKAVQDLGLECRDDGKKFCACMLYGGKAVKCMTFDRDKDDEIIIAKDPLEMSRARGIAISQKDKVIMIG